MDEATTEGHATSSRLGDSAHLLFAALLPPQRFSSPEIEAAFRLQHASRCQRQRCAASLLALLIWMIFGIVELSIPPRHLEVEILRFVGSMSLLVAFAFTIRPTVRIESRAEIIFLFIVLINFICLLRMSMNLDSRHSWLNDYIGISAFLFFVTTQYRIMARTCFFLLSICIVCCAIISPINIINGHTFPQTAPFTSSDFYAAMGTYDYLSSMSYMTMIMVMSYAAAVQLEREARSVFLRERSLALANEELNERRRESEQRSQARLDAEAALRAQAEQESADKSQFLAEATHDLSQPLHAVDLLIDTALQALDRGETAKGTLLLKSASRASAAARASFRAILDISRFESGRVRPVYSSFDLSALVEEILAPLRVIAREEGVDLKLAISNASLWVRSDRALLSRALANLVSNAIKYSDPAKGGGRTVLVAARSRQTRLRLAVVDNGIGIPRDKVAEAFRPFVQLGNHGGDYDKGLGLGLSIVQATVNLLDDHRLALRSIEGRGSCFILTLPAMPPHQMPKDASAAADLDGLFVWCIEKDAGARETLGKLLARLGAIVELSASFNDVDARSPFLERVPDLVLSSLLPAVDSRADDIIRLVASRWPRTPLLILAGDTSPASALVSESHVEIFRGPVETEGLLAAIRRSRPVTPSA